MLQKLEAFRCTCDRCGALAPASNAFLPPDSPGFLKARLVAEDEARLLARGAGFKFVVFGTAMDGGDVVDLSDKMPSTPADVPLTDIPINLCVCAKCAGVMSKAFAR